MIDSLGRDLYGNSHPLGTCVLLEVSSVNNSVQYFKCIHNNHSMLGVSGIHFIRVPVIDQNQVNENNKFNLSFAAAMYSLCFVNYGKNSKQ